MEALTPSILTYGVALSVDVQSADTGRERRAIFMYQTRKCRPPILSIFHLPATHCMAGKWHLAESLSGQRKDLTDGEAHTAFDDNPPGAYSQGTTRSCDDWK